MRARAESLERHQVPLYVAALLGGAAIGLLIPAVARPAELAITPVLGLLLYATFLGVPFADIRHAFRDRRFLATVLAVNFAIAPAVVFVLSRFIAHDEALLIGVLFVLLTPCIDYVIVFAGIAGGARERLVAATPLLMLGQLLLLPVYLWLMVGPAFAETVDPGPFVEAFLLLIALPLAAAALTQLAARTRIALAVREVVMSAMVPLMMLTLAVVVASQIGGVSQELPRLLGAVPIFVAFAAVMTLVGIGAGRVARLDVPAQRAVVFSGVTRNSLVVLPLVLALPATYALSPLVVVTQTLVELLLMVAFVRAIPHLVRMRRDPVVS
ncbi:arsenic resistance protein [Mycetocola manganoxydans]|uniref:Arsenic resistance protein n=1 Tax=Mycetocola manganoxydans TaxID=699879 RepID=A0A3L6ZNA3_9MICO|nr:arsenic resistance protein [Mycetocola manganoxydans]